MRIKSHSRAHSTLSIHCERPRKWSNGSNRNRNHYMLNATDDSNYYYTQHYKNTNQRANDYNGRSSHLVDIPKVWLLYHSTPTTNSIKIFHHKRPCRFIVVVCCWLLVPFPHLYFYLSTFFVSSHITLFAMAAVAIIARQKEMEHTFTLAMMQPAVQESWCMHESLRCDWDSWRIKAQDDDHDDDDDDVGTNIVALLLYSNKSCVVSHIHLIPPIIHTKTLFPTLSQLFRPMRLSFPLTSNRLKDLFCSLSNRYCNIP